MILFYKKYGNESIVITYLFFKKIGLKTPLSIISDFFNSHIYKNTLLCMQDFMSEAGLQTKAIKYSKADIERLPTPFITILHKGFSDRRIFAIVSTISDTTVELLDSLDYTWKQIDRQTFLSQWTKVALLSENKCDKVVKKATKAFTHILARNTLRFIIFALAVFLGAKYFIDQMLSFTIGVLNIFGIIISYFLLQLSFGYNNPITGNLCNINNRFHCYEVLSSKGASIFTIKWAVIGFSFFIVNFNISLVILFFLKKYALCLLVFNSLSLLFVVYSMLYQWLISKKWCLMCLFIQGILIAQFFTLLLSVNGSISNLSTKNVLNSFVTLGLIHLAGLYIVHFVAITKYEYIESRKIKLLAYRQALLNVDVFNLFSQAERKIEKPGMGIFIGNPKAANSLLLISSPSCVFCSDKIMDLLSLARFSQNVYIQVLFACFPSDTNNQRKTVNYFLNLYKNSPTARLCDALYYLAVKKPTCRQLEDAFPLTQPVIDCQTDIDAMETWCRTHQITTVPVLFVNGSALPHMYDIKDLKFILQ